MEYRAEMMPTSEATLRERWWGGAGRAGSQGGEGPGPAPAQGIFSRVARGEEVGWRGESSMSSPRQQGLHTACHEPPRHIPGQLKSADVKSKPGQARLLTAQAGRRRAGMHAPARGEDAASWRADKLAGEAGFQQKKKLIKN